MLRAWPLTCNRFTLEPELAHPEQTGSPEVFIVLSQAYNPISRRRLVRDIVGGLVFSSLTPAEALAAPAVGLQLSPAQTPPIPVPTSFIGLGYEMSSVARPGLLRATNDRYVQLIRLLGPAGVLRVGGIVADYTRYQSEGPAAAEPKQTVITRDNLVGFNEFLARIGWTAIWSLNFAQGTLPEAVAEATAVHSTLGPRLQAFELGNEVENYGNGVRPFRPAPYTYEQYLAEYTSWHTEILEAIPTARFAAPDTAGSVEWVERMATDEHGSLQLLTTHYYRNDQKHGSAAQLLDPDPELARKLVRLQAVAQQSGLPWRMCETNSFSGGGLPGVSNTFLAALWTLDFLLLLATHAAAGVNLETGVNQLGFISSYSPIQDDGHGKSSAGAPFYGMVAFSEAIRGNTHIHLLTTLPAPPRVTAYALGNTTTLRSLVVINRSTAEVEVSLAGLRISLTSVLRLEAPAATSTNGITLGGAAVSPGGQWSPGGAERYYRGAITIPAMSAVVASDLLA